MTPLEFQLISLVVQLAANTWTIVLIVKIRRTLRRMGWTK